MPHAYLLIIGAYGCVVIVFSLVLPYRRSEKCLMRSTTPNGSSSSSETLPQGVTWLDKVVSWRILDRWIRRVVVVQIAKLISNNAFVAKPLVGQISKEFMNKKLESKSWRQSLLFVFF